MELLKCKKSYGIFSNETTSVREIRALQKIFNSDENMNGNIIASHFWFKGYSRRIILLKM